MNILYLGIEKEEILKCIQSYEDQVFTTEDKINDNSEIIKNINFIISYRYRHILKPDILNLFVNKAINIHISLLPYNRGADPNLWSFLENTPKGVTIHYINEGIDTGDILVQKEVNFSNEETLNTSYEKLSKIAVDLFIENWYKIRNGQIKAIPQTNKGTLHYKKDRKHYEHLLVDGWNTQVSNLIGKANL